jgi:alpha-beta hydrolase superfamily lysophospholipase
VIPAAAGAQETRDPAHETARRLVLTTSDGIEIPALEYRTDATGGQPFVLLFHQGGASGPAEYATIAPRLHRMGYDVLVIDQRRGGDLFGGTNSVAVRFDQETTSYCEALPELEAALDYARRTDPARRVILWGSSYSAALVVQLAARRAEDVAGVLAFSPASGDSMDGCRPESFLDAVRAPVLAVRPSSEMAYGWIAEQLELFEDHGHATLVTDPGRHGSSTLVEERVGASTEEAWSVVGDFLSSLALSGSPGRQPSRSPRISPK